MSSSHDVTTASVDGTTASVDGATASVESIDIDASLESPDRSAELLRYHYRLGHLPFNKLKLLAKLGEIPQDVRDAYLVR